MNLIKLVKNISVFFGLLVMSGLQARDLVPTFAHDPKGNSIIKLVAQGSSCGLVKITAKNGPIILKSYLGYEDGSRDKNPLGAKRLEKNDSIIARYDWGKNFSSSSEYWIYVWNLDGNVINASENVSIESIHHNMGCIDGHIAPLNMK